MHESLDRASREPLWEQLARVLHTQIWQDEISSRVPTEHELMRHYGVSRHTVRAALSALQDSGLLERHRGRGTFVNPTALEQPLSSIYSLADTVRYRGLQERSELLEAGPARSARAARHLGLRANRSLVKIRRLRLVDDEPVMLTTAWYASGTGRALLATDLTQGSLYDSLALHLGVRVTGGWERISAARASDDESALLKTPQGEAVLVVERLATGAGVPVEWRTSVMRGDRYTLIANWDDPLAASPDDGRPEVSDPTDR